MPHIFFVLLAVTLPLTPALTSKARCESREAEYCGDQAVQRPVCGTDLRTYSSRCELVKEQCRRQQTPVLPGGDFPKLYMLYKGPCKGKGGPRGQQAYSCWSSRTVAERGNSAYVPECLADGTFAPVQCHKTTNTCWCVNANGKPISKIIVKNTKPDCSRPGKRRRGQNGGRTFRNKKKCNKNEKSKFFNDLEDIYKIEHNQTMKGTVPIMKEEDAGRAALQWKFSTLDKDGDQLLSREEYSELKRLIRKVVKPRECARSFIKLCDNNTDHLLTHDEWLACHSQPRIKNRNGNGNRKRDRDFSIGAPLQSQVPLINTNIYGQSEESTEKPYHPEVNDCFSDQRSAQEELKLPNDKLYIPQCTPDGRYQKIQCYNSTGYCWCVHEDTGDPIPGTSVKNLNPKCDSTTAPLRPMKGCPEPKKQHFLNDLMQFMHQAMQNINISNLENISPAGNQQNIDVKIATWNFLALDENRNKVLEKKEWKTFRSLMSTDKKLRKCGKKFPKYCDNNHDKKISLTEWIDCVHNQRMSPGGPESKRRGPNPVNIFLKDD